MKSKAATPPIEIHDDTLITLEEARSLFFRDKVTVATLRAEAKRGRLALWLCGNKHFTTMAALKEMVQQCLVDQKVQGSTLTKAGASMLSETVKVSCARHALDLSTSALKKTRRVYCKKIQANPKPIAVYSGYAFGIFYEPSAYDGRWCQYGIQCVEPGKVLER